MVVSISYSGSERNEHKTRTDAYDLQLARLQQVVHRVQERLDVLAESKITDMDSLLYRLQSSSLLRG